jgi:hypothetical protein
MINNVPFTGNQTSSSCHSSGNNNLYPDEFQTKVRPTMTESGYGAIVENGCENTSDESTCYADSERKHILDINSKSNMF